MLDILSDENNKDAVDEIVTQFIEKIESESSVKESLITKGRNTEWTNIQNGITESQH